MDFVHFDITGVRQTGIRFDEFPDALYEDLRVEVNALAIELFGRVEAATPDRTGLLRSQERVRLFTDPNRITGYVDVEGGKVSGGPYAKAASLEYGAHASTQVKAHAMGLDHHWALKLASPERVLVEAYNRTPNIAEVAFERGPLAVMQPEIASRLNAVVAKSTAEANS